MECNQEVLTLVYVAFHGFLYNNVDKLEIKTDQKVGAARMKLQNIIKRKLGIRICEYSRILRLESELSDLRMENANQNTCERK